MAVENYLRKSLNIMEHYKEKNKTKLTEKDIYIYIHIYIYIDTHTHTHTNTHTHTHTHTHTYIYIYIYTYILLYRGKEKIHCEIKWFSPTRIISLAMLVLGPNWSHYWPTSFRAISLLLFLLLLPRDKRYGVFYTSAILEVTWYEPLYNIYMYIYIYKGVWKEIAFHQRGYKRKCLSDLF